MYSIHHILFTPFSNAVQSKLKLTAEFLIVGYYELLAGFFAPLILFNHDRACTVLRVADSHRSYYFKHFVFLLVLCG